MHRSTQFASPSPRASSRAPPPLHPLLPSATPTHLMLIESLKTSLATLTPRRPLQRSHRHQLQPEVCRRGLQARDQGEQLRRANANSRCLNTRGNMLCVNAQPVRRAFRHQCICESCPTYCAPNSLSSPGHPHFSRSLPPRDRSSPLRAQEVRPAAAAAAAAASTSLLLLRLALTQSPLPSSTSPSLPSRFGGRGARARYQKSYR